MTHSWENSWTDEQKEGWADGQADKQTIVIL